MAMRENQLIDPKIAGLFVLQPKPLKVASEVINTDIEPDDAELKEIEADLELNMPVNFEGIDSDDHLGLYLREVTRIPLLTKVQEIELAKKMEQGQIAHSKLQRPNRLRADRKMDLQFIVADGDDARKKLVQANTRLVVHMAKKYLDQGVPFLDLIQEGNLHLMKAANKFDWHRGFKFGTYATWWIRHGLKNSLGNGRTIPIPVNRYRQIRIMYSYMNAFEADSGRQPSIAEIASHLGKSLEKIEAMIKESQNPISLELPVGEEGSDEFGSFLVDDDSPDPEMLANIKLLRRDLEAGMNTLTDREDKILRLRNGIDCPYPQTLDEARKQFGLSKERVRQIEKAALRQLNNDHLRSYLE